MNEKSNRRRDDFRLVKEEFRKLNETEYLSLSRSESATKLWINDFTHLRVAYETLPGGFTICLLRDSDAIFTGCSHCSKNDNWLPVRGKMKAFRRAVEHSGGILLQNEEETKGGEEGKGIFEALKDHLDKSKPQIYQPSGEDREEEILLDLLQSALERNPTAKSVKVTQTSIAGPVKVVLSVSIEV